MIKVDEMVTSPLRIKESFLLVKKGLFLLLGFALPGFIKPFLGGRNKGIKKPKSHDGNPHIHPIPLLQEVCKNDAAKKDESDKTQDAKRKLARPADEYFGIVLFIFNLKILQIVPPGLIFSCHRF